MHLYFFIYLNILSTTCFEQSNCLSSGRSFLFIYLDIYIVKENELWTARQNDELEAIIKGENIVRFIKCQRIRWLGHIERMQDTAIPKKRCCTESCMQQDEQEDQE